MKMKALREMDSSHMEHELADKQKHLFDLRTQAVTEKLENPSQLNRARKDIAQIKTVMRQRQMQDETSKTGVKGKTQEQSK